LKVIPLRSGPKKLITKTRNISRFFRPFVIDLFGFRLVRVRRLKIKPGLLINIGSLAGNVNLMISA